MGTGRLAAVALVGLVVALPGCGDASPAAANGQDDRSSGPVEFVVVASSERFAGSGEVRARLWSAEQLESLRQNARCGVSRDPSGAEAIRCPDGVEYREVTPEETSVPAGGGQVRLVLVSQAVEVGEEYRLVVSGPSSDGCNTTTATVESRAEAARIVLDRLVWERTMRGCPGP